MIKLTRDEMQIIVNFMLAEQEFLADGVNEKHTSEAMREVFRVEKKAVDKFLLAAKEMGLDLIEKCVTVEELKSYVDSHCRAGISCEEENGNPWCINHASPELRDEFASKYGCICGSHCERCCNFKECHPNGLTK